MKHLEKKLYVSILDQIVELLIERGYNPYSQLKGYVITNNAMYITSYRSARDMIKRVDVDDVQQYLLEWEKHQDVKWEIEYIKMAK